MSAFGDQARVRFRARLCKDFGSRKISRNVLPDMPISRGIVCAGGSRGNHREQSIAPKIEPDEFSHKLEPLRTLTA